MKRKRKNAMSTYRLFLVNDATQFYNQVKRYLPDEIRLSELRAYDRKLMICYLGVTYATRHILQGQQIHSYANLSDWATREYIQSVIKPMEVY